MGVFVTWASRFVLSGTENHSLLTLFGGGALSIAMLVVMVFVWFANEGKHWPAKEDLAFAEGKVVALEEHEYRIHFYLSGSEFGFSYKPIYGRNWSEVERALRSPDSVIRVGYIPGDTVVVLLEQDGTTVLSYERSQETYADNLKIVPWLAIGIFLIGAFLLARGWLKFKATKQTSP